MTWPWEAWVRAYEGGLYWNSYYAPLVDGVLAMVAVLSLPWVFRTVGVMEGVLTAGIIVFPTHIHSSIVTPGKLSSGSAVGRPQ